MNLFLIAARTRCARGARRRHWRVFTAWRAIARAELALVGARSRRRNQGVRLRVALERVARHLAARRPVRRGAARGVLNAWWLAVRWVRLWRRLSGLNPNP
jgi:hypothetical protein